MRLSITTLSSLLLILPLLGCPTTDEKVDDTGPADADTDTDSDTDADTDADTDTDVTTPYSFAGNVSVSTTRNGDVVCDLEATLTGTPYTGDCEGCDFAVAIASEVTRDDGSADCTSTYSTYSFIEEGDYTDFVMAHADEYVVYGYYGAYYLNDVFMSRYSYYGYDGYYGLVSYTYAGTPYGSGTFARTGDDVTWGLSSSGVSTYLYGYEYCYTAGESAATTSFGGESATSSIACDASTTDIWTFVAGNGAVSVTVDTVSAETAFDPWMWINGSDECAVLLTDDNFDCTFPPPTYMCPSAELEDLTAGDTYEIVVASYGDCTAELVEYQLSVAGASDVQLAMDDVVAGYEYSVEIVGTGTLTAE
ncbi:MAG: hypothetical protein Q8P18_32200 [Pseudomonadota bacterium]|nr:hypothetical protein [Pseudomonadota bacterium]